MPISSSSRICVQGNILVPFPICLCKAESKKKKHGRWTQYETMKTAIHYEKQNDIEEQIGCLTHNQQEQIDGDRHGVMR